MLLQKNAHVAAKVVTNSKNLYAVRTIWLHPRRMRVCTPVNIADRWNTKRTDRNRYQPRITRRMAEDVDSIAK